MAGAVHTGLYKTWSLSERVSSRAVILSNFQLNRLFQGLARDRECLSQATRSLLQLPDTTVGAQGKPTNTAVSL